MSVQHFTPPGMGWIPDLPDPRDYTFRHQKVYELLERLQPSADHRLPDEVDLRCDGDEEYLTKAGDQELLNCSSAFAALSVVEYFERRVFGRDL